MSDLPLVSLVIPVYNTPEEYLVRCLNSVRNQDYENLEVIIVNDGSTKNTVRLLNEFLKELPPRETNSATWIIHHQENRGLSAARNKGYKMASGKYVQFLDSDDFFNKSLVKLAVGRAESTNSEIVIENFEVLDVTSGSKLTVLNPSLFPSNDTFTLADIPSRKFSTIPYNSWSKLFRRDFLEASGIRHDEDIFRAEDILFTYKALIIAKKITFLNDANITYMENIPSSNTASNDKFPEDSIKSWSRLYEYFYENGQYELYRQDFQAALIDSIYWHLERLNTNKGVKTLGLAARKFFKSIDVTSKSERYSLINLASVEPSLTLTVLKIIKQNHILEFKIEQLVSEVNDLSAKLNSFSNPNIMKWAKVSIRKAGAVCKQVIKRIYL